MKNVKIFAMAALMALGLASCNNEIEDGVEKKAADTDVAYLSIKVDMEPVTRAGGGSGEEPGNTAENVLKSLYLITFDDGNKVLGIPGGSATYIAITSNAGIGAEPAPVKVSAAATKLLAIANPGTKLLAKLNAMPAGTTWAALNAAIQQATIGEINTTNGFTMITAGDATDVDPYSTGSISDDNRILVPFVDIEDKVKPVLTTEEDAKDLADADRAEVYLERLTSKLNVAVATSVETPEDATFIFGAWTVDVINRSFFPFAKKVVTSGTHTAIDGRYANHFYTEDPNFLDAAETPGTPPTPNPQDKSNFLFGFADRTATPDKFEPKLPQEDWLAADAATVAYVIENTMEANAQRFGNATRLVIRGTYYPADITPATGDWFQWAGQNYTFTTLKADYAEAAALPVPTESPLYNACEAFLDSLQSHYPSLAGVANFGALTEAALASANIVHGGDVVKAGKTPVIRWYQNGRNYYYYEIRHDNQRDGEMLFSKYGVVRNNSYKLTLNKVNGPGTPWYPDINDPGEGDPDPKDPIDDSVGFLGIEVEVNPWILWETGFEI